MAGMWTAGAAVVGAGAGLAGASKNASASTRAMNSQQAMQQQQLDFQKQQYNRYLNLYGPVEQQLAGQAQSQQPLFYDQNAAAIKQNYSNAQRGLANQMSMRGMAGNGLDQGAMQGAAMGQASALSGAWNQGMVNRQNLGLSLTGRGQIQNSANNVAGSMQGMANLYGNQANLYNNASMASGQAVGQGIQGMGRAFGMMNRSGQAGTPGATGATGWGTNMNPYAAYNGSAWGNETPPPQDNSLGAYDY